MTHVDILNRRLGDALGRVCGGSLPRFAWKWAPSMPRFVYDRDDRTILKKSWADAPAPDGGVLGAVWLIFEWRVFKSKDHCGYGDGIRIAVTSEVGYAPYLETAMAPGKVPTDGLTANYIRVIGDQLAVAAENCDDSFEQLMAEEAWVGQHNAERDRIANQDRAAAEYDKYTGAYGNLSPGQIDGWMSWGGVGDSPVVQKLQDSAAAPVAA